MNYRYLLIILSALLFGVPFFIPSLCILIFLFPVPLLIVMHQKPLSLYESMLFAIAIWYPQLSAPCYALYTIAHGSWIIRSLMPIALVVYMAMITAAWLYISNRVIKKIEAQFIAYWINLFAYIFFIERYSLSFGRWEGYPFANPLVPLAYYPSIVELTHFIGISGTLFLFCLLAGSLTLCISRPTPLSALLLAICIGPWVWAATIEKPPRPTPPWLAQIGHLPCMLKASDKESMAICLNWHIQKLRAQHPLLELIVLPESACTVAPLWNMVPTHPAICLGTFQNNLLSRLNLCCFHSPEGLKTYAKRHTLAFVEGILPSILQKPLTYLFFTNTLPTECGTQKRALLKTSLGVTFAPFICSELFFAHSPDDVQEETIIALCNDWWFPSGYFPRIMALTARLKAITWNRSILYCSYRYAQYFDKYGFGSPICTTPDLYFIE